MPDLDLRFTNEWDMQLTADGDPVLCAGVDLVRQRLIMGLKLFLGEYYLDISKGMPWYQYVLTDQPKTNVIEALFRAKILEDDEITKITSFSMSIEKPTRTLRVSFSAQSALGVINVSEIFP